MGAELPKDVFGAAQGEIAAIPVPVEVAQARDAQEEEDSQEEK